MQTTWQRPRPASTPLFTGNARNVAAARVVLLSNQLTASSITMNPSSYAEQHFEDFVHQLEEWLRIPSISTDPAYRDETRRAAEWLRDHFQALGLENAELIETGGHPVVYAERIEDPALPTVLVYGHYDVQPPDPLDLWESPPFEPVRKDGALYARGTSDDKGQMFIHAKAAEAYLRTSGRLPVNLKFMIEGEEESGSVHLPQFLADNRERLKADIALVSDTAMLGVDTPSITYGLRGLAYTEVTLQGPARDLHSGAYGGAVENPINALARLIAGLHDDDHRVTLPGFYDRVRDLTPDEREAFAALPFQEKEWLGAVGLEQGRTEKGYTTLEGAKARPTLDCNGIWGGYTGDGAKTVLPGKASAKISMRLVPDQAPEEATEQLRRYFEANVPPTMNLTFRDLHGGHGSVTDTSIPAMQAAADAMESVFGSRPHFVREGGSIPVVADFKKVLGLDTVLLGFGLNTDQLHSPNEHFGLDRFEKGIQTVIAFLQRFGETSKA
jgi:acetylornithine deacetylase/succinyl-diaminopimelate desuccinylase-like protein